MPIDESLQAKKLIIRAIGACIGASLFFFILPFRYAESASEFSQWLEGLAGPLGFASLALIAFTTYLQQEQHRLQQNQYRHAEVVEHALVCERLLETYQRLVDTVEIITAQQHAALPEYRKGSRAFALLKAEHDRRVAMVLPESARNREVEKFLRKYNENVSPFVDLMIALMDKTSELKDDLKCEAIIRRAIAVASSADREMLVLFCPFDRAAELKAWLRVQ